jgi:hypothetical protein
MEATIKKMMRIVRGHTGASQLYRDMLLSMLPNSEHKVNIGYWCYKADRDDFIALHSLMQQVKNGDDIIWEYEKLLRPYIDELEQFKED